MTRKFVISATASLVVVWAVSAKAEGLQGTGFFQTSAASQSHFSQYPQSRAWPVTNHEPAIGKSLRVPQATALQSTPDTDYQYEWQHQPAPPAPYLATPQQFSYPKQGSRIRVRFRRHRLLPSNGTDGRRKLGRTANSFRWDNAPCPATVYPQFRTRNPYRLSSLVN